MSLLQNARAVWRTLVVILTPTLLLPLIVRSSQESRCGYVVLVMAVYWVTEALPLAVTALLPVVLFPLLGVMKSRDVGTMYFKDVLFFLMGTLVVAAATEETKLHRRFALRFLLLVGVKPRRLLLGVMLVTWFLSMWMTNVATTAMMTPIARVLLARLFDAKRQQRQALKGPVQRQKLMFCA
ncbi:hypothetical protein BaRGS_00014685 [Batillaria attramentaria]|uniref:Uncharacterized protein n=1 Tax=Batillaria attramentaria TaxID=370345 RepID=A0ABD0L3N3_9CAEN